MYIQDLHNMYPCEVELLLVSLSTRLYSSSMANPGAWMEGEERAQVVWGATKKMLDVLHSDYDSYLMVC